MSRLEQIVNSYPIQRIIVPNRRLLDGEIVTVDGEDFVYDGRTGKLRNIRNLQETLRPDELRETPSGWSA
ncbi:hypothetical protein STSP2_01900 [Anaerohalosphaera lusitana]|uniref:Uncharacterized protein n=1 Tax=Anaerohalosphaera lusitana TaxID=1936003 RepID=A0A1U9NLW7_9BACT|nr:hypothetical protein [Anaerohalosphaera lusitana]AQT68728.1 hypothetical protein STSP2_01900 [Anaerohalosphaera lusitana]